MSQPRTNVLLILYLCHGQPVMVPNTTLLSLRALVVTVQGARPIQLLAAFLGSSVETFTPLEFQELTTTVKGN